MLIKGKFVSWAVYALYLIAVIVLVDYAFFKIYSRKYRSPDLKLSDKKLSEFQSRIGWMQKDKRSSYVNFSEAKSPGVIRVGCFGDSFAYGHEVDDKHDYPSLLQKLFRENGYDNVEVINFGASGYGFHQTYMMWEWANKAYDLDFVLLNPSVSVYERDGTFMTKFGLSGDVLQTHARYILKNDSEIERVDLVGHTQAQIVGNYWRFLPSLRYLRFDRDPPGFLSAPLACLFQDKRLKSNPFYYRKDFEGEMDAIYKILLRKIAEGSFQVILGTYKKDIMDLGKKAGKENLFVTLLDHPGDFPYKAFGAHNSPLGNQFLAQQMFDCLTNKTEVSRPLLEIRDIDTRSAEGVPGQKVRLSSYKKIALEINGVPIGRFFDTSFKWQRDHCFGRECISRVDTLSRIASFLLIENSWKGIMRSVFLPLDFEIMDDSPIIARVSLRDGGKDHPLGRVQLLSPGLNIARAGFLYYENENIFIKKEAVVSNNTDVLTRGDSVTILIKGVPVLSGKVKNIKDSDILLEPVNKGLFMIAPDGREIVDVDALPPEGVVTLSLQGGEAPSVKVPFAGWRKVNKKISLGSPRLHFIPLK